MSGHATSPRKYQHVYQSLHQLIRSGRLKEGDRLPSEADLVREFGASRITISRAVRDLQRAGFVERHAGSGTYVRLSRPDAEQGRVFGLLIPDLGDTEIFEPICQGMTSAPVGQAHALLRGSTAGASTSRATLARQLAKQYIDRRVDGVFFAPLELVPAKDEVNGEILQALDEAGIAVVLLDRPAAAFPRSGRHDLVGIDNRRAGHTVTEHLLSAGARRVGFVGFPNAASTVDARRAGYRAALQDYEATDVPSLVLRVDPRDTEAIGAYLARESPDGIVCGNDRTAALLMQTLLALGRAIPRDIRLVGIDDVDYAGLLPVPLTTLRQPCAEIGVAAMAAMLERLAHPELPPRDILLHTTLIVRQSCGASLPQASCLPAASL